MQYADFFQLIHTSLDKHHHWRSQTLNLSAAENLHSPDVHRLLATDLTQRYGDYRGRDPSARKYQVTRYIQELEAIATELAQEGFHTRYVELRGISGHITDVAVMLGLARAGSVILGFGIAALWGIV